MPLTQQDRHPHLLRVAPRGTWHRRGGFPSKPRLDHQRVALAVGDQALRGRPKWLDGHPRADVFDMGTPPMSPMSARLRRTGFVVALPHPEDEQKIAYPQQ